MNFSELITNLKSKKGILFLFIYLLALLPIAKTATAQTSKADSLKSELQKNIHDTTRINLLNDLAWELKDKNIDTSIILSKKALELSEKHVLNRGKRFNSEREVKKNNARSLFYLGLFNYLKGNNQKVLIFYNKALDIYDAIDEKKGKSAILGSLGNFYSRQSDYNKALDHFMLALGIDKELKNSTDTLEAKSSISRIAKTLCNIGIIYSNKGNYPKALDYYYKALDTEKYLENKDGIARQIGNIGNIFAHQGDYPNALNNYFKALEIFKELGNKRQIAIQFTNIGTIYQKQHNITITLNYYLKALEMYKEIGNKKEIAIIYGNLGIVYAEQTIYQNALNHYLKSLKINNEMGNKKELAIGYNNIGVVYKNLGDYTKSLDNFYKALEISKKIGDKSGISTYLCNIGSLYLDQKQFKFAEEYLINSFLIAKELGSWEHIKFRHINLSILYAQSPPNATIEGRKRGTKNALYSFAFEHYEKYLQAKDTLFNEEKSENMGKLEARHEFALMEIEREKLERERQLAVTAEIKKRNTVQYSVIFMVMVVVILIAVLFLFTKFKMHWLTGGVESHKLKTGSVFITLLLLFEFILLMTDAEIEKITGSDPVFKLGINAILATAFYFIQHFAEKILSLKKLSTSITSQQVISIFIFFLVIPVLIGLTQEKNLSTKNTKSVTKNAEKVSTVAPLYKVSPTMKPHPGVYPDTGRAKGDTNNVKIDSLKSMLVEYQYGITSLRNQNKQKEAYEVIQKYGDTKDSLQKWEQSQEFAKIKEKQDIEIQKIKEQEKTQVTATLLATQKERKNNLKYSGILIFIIVLFVFISTAKKYHISLKVVEGGLFVSFLLFFEFIIVFADPYIEGFTGGAPAWKLLLNLAVALVIFPLHQILERKVKGRVVGH